MGGFVSRFCRWSRLSLLTLLGVCAVGPAATTRAADEAGGVAFFETSVRPILQNNCVKCHGGEKTKGGLKLTTHDNLLKGGDQGPAVKPDAPDASLLLVAVGYKNDDLQMPPKKRLPAEQVEVLTRWVKMGLPWTPGLDLASGAGSVAAAGETARVGPPKPEQARDFWSFRPVKRPDVPPVK